MAPVLVLAGMVASMLVQAGRVAPVLVLGLYVGDGLDIAERRVEEFP